MLSRIPNKVRNTDFISSICIIHSKICFLTLLVVSHPFGWLFINCGMVEDIQPLSRRKSTPTLMKRFQLTVQLSILTPCLSARKESSIGNFYNYICEDKDTEGSEINIVKSSILHTFVVFLIVQYLFETNYFI